MGSDVYSIRRSPTDGYYGYCSFWQGSYKLRELACSFIYYKLICYFRHFSENRNYRLYGKSYSTKVSIKAIYEFYLVCQCLQRSLSALLDGLLAIAVLVPILLKITKMMKLSPVPFLIIHSLIREYWRELQRLWGICLTE